MVRSKYPVWLEPDGLSRLEGWAREGLSDRQIARQIGCAPSTLRTWMERYPPIFNALLKGRDELCRKVEDALLKRALGYQYQETTIEFSTDPKTGLKKETSKTVIKEAQPSTAAQFFWLKNRRPDRWRSSPVAPNTGGNLVVARKLLNAIPSAINSEETVALSEVSHEPD